MFRCFGHEAISVLNGGFRHWLEEDLPTESGEPKPARSKSEFLVVFSCNSDIQNNVRT